MAISGVQFEFLALNTSSSPKSAFQHGSTSFIEPLGLLPLLSDWALHFRILFVTLSPLCQLTR